MSLTLIKGISGGVDKRGKVSATFRAFIQADSLEEALAHEVPVPTKLPYTHCDFHEYDVDNRSFVFDCHYEGVIVEFPTDGSKDLLNITRERREEPIEAFPDRLKLVSQYGAYVEDGRLLFPEYLPGDGQASGGNALSGNKGGKGGKQNPMFGITTYPITYAVAVHNCVRFSVPSEWYADEDTIIKSLPTMFARFNYPGGKPWVVDPVVSQQRGNCMEIQRKWRQIDKQKHIEALQLLLSGGK